MNILYVVSRAIEINTSASVRNRATILGLIENGHSVTIVSSEPDSEHSCYDASLSIEAADKIYFKTGTTHLVTKLSKCFIFLNKIKPIVYKMLYGSDIYDNLKGIINYADKINVEKFDLVISSSDPKSSHLFVDKMFEQSKKKVRWIQIWGDPFADDITCCNTKKLKETSREEERLLSLADKVVYVSDLTCESQKNKYSKYADKMCYIPIPYEKERIYASDFPNDYSKVKLCYCGDYNSKIRNILPLYEAVKELNINMTVCGMSDIKLSSDKKIEVLPRQNSEIVKEKEGAADVLVHLSNLSGTQIPGKIYQYISTDKRILFILDGDVESLRETFEGYNRFIFVENKKADIIEVLKNIVVLSNKVKNEPVKQFNASHISKRIIE